MIISFIRNQEKEVMDTTCNLNCQLLIVDRGLSISI